MRFHVACAVAVLLTTAQASAQGDESLGMLFGQKPKPFIEPSGLYAAILPPGFNCEAKARRVTCNGNRGVQAQLTIDVLDVPASANADIAMLNQMDKFKRKPHFKLLQKGRIKIDGSPAVLVNFTYDYMKNVEYQIAVEEVVLVRGGKLYVIHQEMRLDQLNVHKKDLEQLYRSFKPGQSDDGSPVAEDLQPIRIEEPTGESDVDRALNAPF